MTDKFRVGVITKTHGIKGEVSVFPTTDDNDRFEYLEKCYIKTGNKYTEVKVFGCKYFKNTVILKFEGLDKIEDVEKYIRSEIYVDRDDALALEDGEYYLADLIGLDVYEENGNKLGKIKDYLETPVQIVYIIEQEEEGKKDIMIPDVPEFIKDINLEENKMTVKLLKGMI